MWAEAGQHALSSLLTSYEAIRQDYAVHWRNWQQTLKKLDAKPREKIYTGPARPFCARMNPRIFSAASSPVFPFPGASTRATRTWAATT
jgi:hypothetical protein